MLPIRYILSVKHHEIYYWLKFIEAVAEAFKITLSHFHSSISYPIWNCAKNKQFVCPWWNRLLVFQWFCFRFVSASSSSSSVFNLLSECIMCLILLLVSSFFPLLFVFVLTTLESESENVNRAKFDVVVHKELYDLLINRLKKRVFSV